MKYFIINFFFCLISISLVLFIEYVTGYADVLKMNLKEWLVCYSCAIPMFIIVNWGDFTD